MLTFVNATSTDGTQPTYDVDQRKTIRPRVMKRAWRQQDIRHDTSGSESCSHIDQPATAESGDQERCSISLSQSYGPAERPNDAEHSPRTGVSVASVTNIAKLQHVKFPTSPSDPDERDCRTRSREHTTTRMSEPTAAGRGDSLPGGLFSVSKLGVNPKNCFQSMLFDKYVESFFPNAVYNSPALPSWLAFWKQPRTLAMEAATDAFALLHLAHKTKDTRIQLEGQKRHLAAIMCLRQDLQNPIRDDVGTLACINLLSACDMYLQPSPSSLSVHINGMSIVFAASNRSTAPRTLIDRQHVYLSFMQGILDRQSLRARELLPHLDLHTVAAGSLTKFMLLAITLPKHMQSVDDYCRETFPDYQTKLRLQLALLNLEDKLREWMRQFCLRCGLCLTRQALDANDGLPNLEEVITQCELGHVHLLYLSLYRICLLCIYQSLSDLASLENGADSHEHPCITSKGDNIAQQLCALVPYLSRTSCSVISEALALVAPFHFVRIWYSRTDNEKCLSVIQDREQHYRTKAKNLQWHALLPWSFFILHWLD